MNTTKHRGGMQDLERSKCSWKWGIGIPYSTACSCWTFGWEPPVCPSPSLRHRPMSVRGLCRPAGLTVLDKRIPPSCPYGLSVLEALVPYALSSRFVWPFLLVLMANAQLIAEIESRDLRSVNSNRSLLFILYSLIIYFCRYECKEQLNAANEELAMIVSCLRRCFVRWYLDSASQMFSLGYWLAGVDWSLDWR